MYIPKPFEQNDWQQVCDFIARHPLAVVAAITSDGIETAPLPLILSENNQGQNVLIGHMARQNPLAQAQSDSWVAVFQDSSHYITPNWYPAKQQTHQVVPTWNYQSIRIGGQMRVLPDNLAVLAEQTEAFERMLPSNTPWQLSDAPAEFLNNMCRGIISFEIIIEEVQAAFKLSQNKDPATRASICRNLRRLNRPQADHMAGLIETFA